MFVVVQIIIGVAFLTALIFLVARLVKVYRRYRGKMLITCPENKQPAVVEVDAKYAALTATLEGENLTLKNCTRWPEMQNCGQECLSQIEKSPEGCQVRNILDRWFKDRRCAFCHTKFEHIHWHDHKPALLSPDNVLLEWHEIPVEELPQILETHAGVCWNCYVTESFRRQHPELVVERPDHRDHLIK